MASYHLKKLIQYFDAKMQPLDMLDTILSKTDITIEQLKSDSRFVKENDVFIALKGQNHDGRNFINQAIDAGACAVLVETDDLSQDRMITFHQNGDKNVPQIHIHQLSLKISAFANQFYDCPSEQMMVVGVTGTNGKTTVTQLIAQWVELVGKRAAVLGTIGNGLFGQLSPSINTTPSNVEIQSYLSRFRNQKADLVAMEVSSHGLALGRVDEVSFAATVFTNLSRDHLDFHQTMEKYENAKWSLFTPVPEALAVKSSGIKIINFDDDIGKKWINRLDQVIAVSVDPNCLNQLQKSGKRYLCVSSLTYHSKGVSIEFESSFGAGTLESRLFGAFNVSNLFLAFATLLALAFPFYALVNTAPHLLPVKGRMEIFRSASQATAIVDYAHTPDALDKALCAAKDHCNGKLWLLFGCGGDRDKGKRPLMAKVAQSHADHIIVTNDNPRTEDQDQIIADIIVGFDGNKPVKVIKDRYQAIKWMIEKSDKDDLLLIVGKGHEEYQIIGTTKYHYSDRQTVDQLLGITS